MVGPYSEIAARGVRPLSAFSRPQLANNIYTQPAVCFLLFIPSLQLICILYWPVKTFCQCFSQTAMAHLRNICSITPFIQDVWDPREESVSSNHKSNVLYDWHLSLSILSSALFEKFVNDTRGVTTHFIVNKETWRIPLLRNWWEWKRNANLHVLFAVIMVYVRTSKAINITALSWTAIANGV